MRIWLTYLFFVLFGTQTAQEIVQSLNSNWTFRMKDSGQWLPASVPGCVHSDLYRNSVIPDPYYGTNEKKLQWIENKTWEYRCRMDLGSELLSCPSLLLNFEGLDTYADVYLNETLVLSSDNMFRTYRVNVKPYVKEKENILRVVFHPAIAKAKEKAARLKYTLPGEERVFVRKAQYQFGWDWAPRFVTCGIWKNVSLQGFRHATIDQLDHHYTILNEKKAVVHFSMTTNVSTEGKYQLVVSNKQKIAVAVKTIALGKGLNTSTIQFEINNPKLWWCNGLGTPHLYDYTVELKKENAVLCKRNTSIGLRTIELRQQKDSIGTSFTFVVNGHAVFMRGANYVPASSFPSELTAEDHEELIRMARSSGMNMIRVWGGGVYPDEDFLKSCDRNGILVWQDLMFACAMYPGDTAFVNSVKQEIRDNVQRIEQHPCLALWCGNNENDEGWHNWGWQKQYQLSKSDSAEIWNHYTNLFHKIVPEILKEQGSITPYWPSSPSIGWGRKESLTKGDAHYWGVWWGMEPFEVYRQKTGRFMSEYGFQSMPALYNFKKVMRDEELHLNSEAMKNHQKHPTGYETIFNYMQSQYTVPRELEKLSYASQLLQRDGMAIAIRAHRSEKPVCMGTLFWQLNDCWPGTSWSAIDYYKRPKALYYALRKLYGNFTIQLGESNDTYYLELLNDSLKAVNGDLSISFRNFKGDVIFSDQTKDITVNAESALRYHVSKEYIDSVSIIKGYFFVEFGKGSFRKSYLLYPSAMQIMALPKPEYTIEQKSNQLFIKAGTFVKDLYISIDDGACVLSDNYFDLQPGETKIVNIISLINNKNTLKTISYYDQLH